MSFSRFEKSDRPLERCILRIALSSHKKSDRFSPVDNITLRVSVSPRPRVSPNNKSSTEADITHPLPPIATAHQFHCPHILNLGAAKSIERQH